TSGPSTRPAAISPITGGWPKWRNTAPQSLADASTSTSCSNSSNIGLMAGRPCTQHACPAPAWLHGDPATCSLQDVDEAVDRQAPAMDVRRRHARAVDVARMQRVASIHHHAVVDALHAVDLFEQGGIPIDIARPRRILAQAFLLQGLEVGRMARGVHILEAGRAMAVERRPTPIPRNR